jgi:hypothetical protein
MSRPDSPGKPALTLIEGGADREALAHALLLEYISPLPLEHPRVRALEARLFSAGTGQIQLAGGADTFRL